VREALKSKNMLLKLEKVTKKYLMPDESFLTVLDNLCLKVKEGEAVAVVGPSGSGKSTLLNLIGALDRPTSGSVKLKGREISSLNEKTLAYIRNREIGFVFQMHHLLPQCTVLENVLIPTIPFRDNKKADQSALKKRAVSLCKEVGLDNHLHVPVTRLSGGEMQRTALARALINRPKLLLADEPTGSLDRAASGEITTLLCRLNQQEKVTLLVVTHSEVLAGSMEKIYRLENGSLIEVLRQF
jgi:lipoprotein-releasing system ATP-binding protein